MVVVGVRVGAEPGLPSHLREELDLRGNRMLEILPQGAYGGRGSMGSWDMGPVSLSPCAQYPLSGFSFLPVVSGSILVFTPRVLPLL